MILNLSDRNYLISRGYDDAGLQEDPWFSLGAGTYSLSGARFTLQEPSIALVCRSLTGKPTAIHTANPTKKAYRKFTTDFGESLPTFYASKIDYANMWANREAMLVEGIFDRRAIRCLSPKYGVMALLGLSFPDRTKRWLQTFCKRVWVLVDHDEAGVRASSRIARELGCIAKEILVPYCKDAGEWLSRDGKERMSKELADRLDLAQRMDL